MGSDGRARVVPDHDPRRVAFVIKITTIKITPDFDRSGPPSRSSILITIITVRYSDQVAPDRDENEPLRTAFSTSVIILVVVAITMINILIIS